jgi:mannose-6-phosphate isomerase-like protein (cupin superfamily)
MMIVKLLKDHIVKESPTCGELHEILIGNEYPFLNIAVSENIKPTKAHYHNKFDEIYFVLDGYIGLRLFDPRTERVLTQYLSANELCVISKGVHHEVIESSDTNKICIISVPGFHSDDEHLSDKI